MTKALKNHINCSEMLNAIQERKRCNRLVILLWRNIILIGDHFGVDLGIISGDVHNCQLRSALMNKTVKCINNETILPPNCRHIWLGSCVWFEDFKQRCQYCWSLSFTLPFFYTTSTQTEIFWERPSSQPVSSSHALEQSTLPKCFLIYPGNVTCKIFIKENN